MKPIDTREEVAEALGLSGAQYSRMKRVVGAAEDESLDDETRIVALEAQEQMDKGEISVTRADEIVRTAKASAPPSSSVVRLSEAQRVEQINRLADTGRTSDQIGAEIGVGEEQVRAIARRNDITITADELLRGRKRVRIDHNHVVNHLVATLEGLMTGPSASRSPLSSSSTPARAGRSSRPGSAKTPPETSSGRRPLEGIRRPALAHNRRSIAMPTATLVKQKNGRGNAAVYRCNPPMPITDWNDKVTGETEYVWVSAADVPYSGVETYIFPSDADGNVTDWDELPGSYQGGMSHEVALGGAGYELVQP